MIVELGPESIKQLGRAIAQAAREPEPMISKERVMELANWTESQIYNYNKCGLPHTDKRPTRYLWSEVVAWVKDSNIDKKLKKRK